MCLLIGCIIYVDIMTGEILALIYFANKEIIYRSVRSSSGGEGVGFGKEGGVGGDRYFSPLQSTLY